MPLEQLPIVASNNIGSVAYDADTQTMYVAYRSGKIYQYPGVAGDDAYGISNSLSAGKYIWDLIQPRYPGQEIPATAIGDPQFDPIFQALGIPLTKQ